MKHLHQCKGHGGFGLGKGVACVQTFAEKLFVRLQRSSGEKMETRMAVITLISRVVGVHRLILLNFYPFLQRYLQPHQRDVTTLLAALIQVCPLPAFPCTTETLG